MSHIQRIGTVPNSCQYNLRLILFAFLILITNIMIASASARSDAVWRDFRQHNPFHSQTVGLTGANRLGQRVLIISEPPPLLPRSGFRKALASIFGSALQDAELKRHTVGYDGWTEDVVAQLTYPPTPEGNKALANDMVRLAQHLFGTAYKFSPVQLHDPTNPPGPTTDRVPSPRSGQTISANSSETQQRRHS